MTFAEKKNNKESSKEDSAAKAAEELKRPIWERLDAPAREAVEALATEYREFLSLAKTERAVARLALDRAAAAGFAGHGAKGRGGWLHHHGKLLGLYAPGLADPREGFNVVVAHGDAPRLDLKPKCVYEESGLGLLKSNLYGGLKKFQWLSRPLALWGFCALKDGREVEVRLGEAPGDPVLTITDILPHLDRKVQREKKLTEAFPAERLNVLAASRPAPGKPSEAGRLKKAVLDILEARWGLKEDDLISSEFELVPAGPAQEVGFDRSMIGGYGHDDRLSVFCAVKALLAIEKPAKPLLLIVFDREEIGSYGSTGAESNFVVRLAAAAVEAAGLEPRWHDVQTALARSSAISADVEAALDPTFKEVHDELNAARLGFGPCVIRYTGGTGKYGASEARAEYMALIRKIFDEAGVVWQSTLLGKQEEGGGGTVALSLAAQGMSVVDCGAPVLSMHSPFEIVAKSDVWMTARALEAFLRNA
ncbi:MAG: aminopeptidase [Deltaproteobacteria bacterium]|jgi:aspartyl aminopeptidase|nr:aminopeptidase [Deltaproteobacteria bacterium]